jgi:hypothetical protein
MLSGVVSQGIALTMDAVSTLETSVNFCVRLHGSTSQKTVIFILAVVKT